MCHICFLFPYDKTMLIYSQSFLHYYFIAVSTKLNKIITHTIFLTYLVRMFMLQQKATSFYVQPMHDIMAISYKRQTGNIKNAFRFITFSITLFDHWENRLENKYSMYIDPSKQNRPLKLEIHIKQFNSGQIETFMIRLLTITIFGQILVTYNMITKLCFILISCVLITNQLNMKLLSNQKGEDNFNVLKLNVDKLNQHKQGMLD